MKNLTKSIRDNRDKIRDDGASFVWSRFKIIRNKGVMNTALNDQLAEMRINYLDTQMYHFKVIFIEAVEDTLTNMNLYVSQK
ncbi:hypothetical protein ACJMK2_003737 [Sinanodonta woodiana]|uniref:Uncharacterized protein n=1 Tax=Sinanodonta woodiana TaxID=1069815 RepID=A0ABD3Y277_SINWO